MTETKKASDLHSRTLAYAMAEERARQATERTQLDPVKISVTLSGEEYAILQRLASKQGIKAADALRKAIVTEDFIKSQIRAGKKIMIKNSDNTIQEVIFF